MSSIILTTWTMIRIFKFLKNNSYQNQYFYRLRLLLSQGSGSLVESFHPLVHCFITFFKKLVFLSSINSIAVGRRDFCNQVYNSYFSANIIFELQVYKKLAISILLLKLFIASSLRTHYQKFIRFRVYCWMYKLSKREFNFLQLYRN